MFTRKQINKEVKSKNDLYIYDTQLMMGSPKREPQAGLLRPALDPERSLKKGQTESLIARFVHLNVIKRIYWNTSKPQTYINPTEPFDFFLQNKTTIKNKSWRWATHFVPELSSTNWRKPCLLALQLDSLWPLVLRGACFSSHFIARILAQT